MRLRDFKKLKSGDQVLYQPIPGGKWLQGNVIKEACLTIKNGVSVWLISVRGGSGVVEWMTPKEIRPVLVSQEKSKGAKAKATSVEPSDWAKGIAAQTETARAGAGAEAKKPPQEKKVLTLEEANRIEANRVKNVAILTELGLLLGLFQEECGYQTNNPFFDRVRSRAREILKSLSQDFYDYYMDPVLVKIGPQTTCTPEPTKTDEQ